MRRPLASLLPGALLIIAAAFASAPLAHAAGALSFSTAPATAVENTPVQFIVTAPDDSGYVINLSDGASGTFYNGNSGSGTCQTSPLTSVTITASSTHKAFCYANATPGTYTITASDAGSVLTATSSAIIITAPTDVYVDAAAGNDSNTGLSAGAAFATIAHALSVVAAGGTIHLAAGTYTESSSLAITQSVTIEGPNTAISPNGGSRAAEAIITGAAPSSQGVFNISSTATVAFKGLEFETTGEPIRSFAAGGATIDIEKDLFTGHSTEDYMQFGSVALTLNDNLFSNLAVDQGDTIQMGGGSLTASGNYWTNVSSTCSLADPYCGGALNLSGVTGTITGNHFDGVEDYGVNIAGASNLTIDSANVFNAISNPYPTYDTLGAGIRFYDDVTSVTSADIHDNTFSNSAFGVSVKSGADTSGAVSLYHNSFSGNAANVYNKGTTLAATPNWWGASASSTVESLVTGTGTTTIAPWYTDAGMTTESNAVSVSSFDIAAPAVTGVVDNTAHTVALTLPAGTDATNLTPTIAFTGAYITPASGIANDFSTSPVTYTVTSVDGSVSTGYAVTTTEDQAITVDAVAPASAIYGNGFSVAAHASSGLPVMITTSGGCSDDGAGNVTMTSGTTDCVVHFNQAGTGFFNAASEVTETVAAEKATLTVTGITASDKVYDASDVATLDLGGATLVGATSTDSIAPDYSGATGTFSDANAGVGKTVTISGITTDANPADYDLIQPTATATITQEPLTVAAQHDVKTYDGTADSSLLPVITSGALQGSDTAGFTQSFDTRNAGTGKTLMPAGVVNDGNGGANYDVTFVDDTTGVINKEVLNIAAVANTKTYDGTTAAAATPDVTSGAIQTGDTAAFVETYDTANVGTGKTLTPSGVVSDGNGGHNYQYFFGPDSVGEIDQAPLSITADDASKTYGDALTLTGTEFTWSGLENGETIGSVTLTSAGADASADVSGSPYAITPSAATGGTFDPANYAITYNDGSLTVDPKDITVTVDPGQEKVYGAGDPASYTYTNDALVGSDTLTGSLTRDAGEDVGTYAITQGTLDVPNGNYTLTFAGDDFAITPAPLTVTADDASKTAGAADPALTYAHGALQGADTDSVFSGALARDAGENVGTYPITQGSLTAGANYAIAFTGATFSVNPDPLAGSMTVATSTNPDSTVSGTIPGGVSTTTPTAGGDATVAIPAGATVTGPALWDGVVDLPVLSTSYTAPSDDGFTDAVTAAIEVGAGSEPLTFDKGVRILFAGQAGQHVGFSRGGAFTEITATCASDSQATGDALAAGGDCKINVGSDLVVWTKHFTTFLTYSKTANPVAATGHGGGGGGFGCAAGTAWDTASHACVATGAAPAAGQVLGASVYRFTRDLALGASGADVTALQQFLIGQGYAIPAGATGYFGAQTRAAVIAYQKATGIAPAAGYVGAKTRAKLNEGVVPAAPGLSAGQKQSIIDLLASFDADPGVIANVKKSLGL